MSKILTLAFAAAALAMAASTADATPLRMGQVSFGAADAHIIPADFDDVADDNDGSDDEDTDKLLIVDDIEDCEPGKYRWVEYGDIEIPVACK